MIRIAIVDDDREDAQVLQKHLAAFGEKEQVAFTVSVFNDGEELLARYHRGSFDLIFLDIEMKHSNGLKTAEQIRDMEDDTDIIFVTQMAQYAVHGYRVDALDYMVKPIHYFSFELVMRKVMKKLSRRREQGILIQCKDGIHVLSLADLYYIEVFDHYLTYHARTGEIRVKGKLQDVEESVKDKGFCRCNRCYLVNIRHIREMKKDSIVVGDTEIEVSRQKKKELVRQITAYMENMS